jgi:hypothetical protein
VDNIDDTGTFKGAPPRQGQREIRFTTTGDVRLRGALWCVRLVTRLDRDKNFRMALYAIRQKILTMMSSSHDNAKRLPGITICDLVVM